MIADMRTLFLLLTLSSLALAQNPQVATAKGLHDLIKTNILKSTDSMPEAKYSYRPVDSVRTYAQVLMHIADAQYLFCRTVKDGKGTNNGIEKSALASKGEIVKALTDAFAYCDSVYAGLTDADSAAMVNMFGTQRTKLGILSFNTAHAFEHYGNLVTYLRMNGIVPPSSEGQPPAGQKKK
jgi:uncharacterized damage-inducible protein DinB